MTNFSINIQKYSAHIATQLWRWDQVLYDSNVSPGIKLVPFVAASLFTSVPVKCATELALALFDTRRAKQL